MMIRDNTRAYQQKGSLEAHADVFAIEGKVIITALFIMFALMHRCRHCRISVTLVVALEMERKRHSLYVTVLRRSFSFFLIYRDTLFLFKAGHEADSTAFLTSIIATRKIPDQSSFGIDEKSDIFKVCLIVFLLSF